jgi:DNA-binding transcriptional regulator YdaS (Cro superfamily)
MFLPIPCAVSVSAATVAAMRHAIVTALDAVGMKQETLARLMGITPVHLHQQLHGLGHLSMPRLLMAGLDADGRAFWRALMPELAALVGVEDIDGIAAHLAKAVALLERRNVKAESATREERRTA